MKDFRALIIGNDINAYYLARCYHELTGKKADLIGLIVPGVKPYAYTRYTKILNIKYVENLWDEKVFLNALNEYYLEHKKEKILLVSSNETYGEFIAKNQDKLKKKFYFNYPSVDLQNTLVNKEKFYKAYENSIIDLPKTIYYDCNKDDKIDKDIMFPVIVKPANVILFKHITFKGKKKIYRLNSMEELNEVINNFKVGGYNDTLIIQEYIPGDDSKLFDAVVYADKDSKVKLVSFAQIGLQEHAPSMIGNAAVIINGYSEYPGVTEQINKIKDFIESINYQGFAEFDMKYDERDGKFKVMEINARQGRCSYYITPCGFNLIEILARDLIFNDSIEYQVVEKQQLEVFVPKCIVKKYIVNEKYKEKVLELWKSRVNPLDYKKDNGILRKLLLLKIKLNYIKAYKENIWDWN
ncbi:MAG: carboxylate--amine ligase [Bacilli bacterium]|nr:carboxylate--amine ligase [Bacilli bacterium]